MIDEMWNDPIGQSVILGLSFVGLVSCVYLIFLGISIIERWMDGDLKD